MTMTVEAVPGQKLYRAVVGALRREVESGRFAEAQLLPAERVLCELLDVSRTTLRKAIADLVDEGVLLHRHGAGTFIHRARPRVDQPSSRLTSFTEDMRLRGLEASSRELERGVFLPTPEEAMMLGARPNERVFRLGRLRLADGLPMAIERATIDPIRHRPDVDTLLVTFGLSSMIVGAIEYVWGTGTTLLPPPSPFTGTVDVLGNQYPLYRLVAALVSLLVSAGVFAIIQFTPMGLRIRAITDDPGMAEALGVNIKRLLTLVFGFAAGLAALAGALGSPIFAIHPEMGMNILIDSFLVVVLGGLGSLTGSAIGAFFVALTKSIGGGYFAEWSTAFLFLIVALALIVRPTGVFGQGRVA